ncbi:MAG: KpsF/GutQ family sugar-phosphate isomerase [Saprospiraceae bacterium]
MNSDTLIVKTARKTLEIEANCLLALHKSINEDFVACVKAIYSSPGRLVITGIGKSAIIAQKIVATLNSTGTPALFMHAADAIHGDLGMIRPYDIVLCLSKSGETAEIKVLVPLVKNLGNPIIGMVTNRQSYLGKQANYILHTPIKKEADPNNLAPTTSTTAQLAMGDALATSLLALRGFTPNDFAQFHPGGSLGKQLYLRVSAIYPNNEKPAVKSEDTLQRTILEMTSKCLGATAVLNDENRLVGIVTDGDLRRMLERSLDLSQLKAKDLMNAQPKTIAKEALAVNALSMLRQYSITQLIVLEGEDYVGMIHLHNLLKEGLI